VLLTGIRAAPKQWNMTVNQEFGNQAFDQIEKLFKGARVPENVQALTQQSVTASKDFYSKTAEAVGMARR
jgi:hypothetical protein